MNCDIYSEDEFYKEEGWPTESFKYCSYHLSQNGEDYYEFALVTNAIYPYVRLAKMRGVNHYPCGRSSSPATDGMFASMTDTERDKLCPKIAWGFVAEFLINLSFSREQDDYVLLRPMDELIRNYYNRYLNRYQESHNGLRYSGLTDIQKELDFISEHEEECRTLWKKSEPLKAYSLLYKYAASAEEDYERYLEDRKSALQEQNCTLIKYPSLTSRASVIPKANVVETYYPASGNLFNTGDTYSLFENIRGEIKSDLGKLKDEYIINVSEQGYCRYLEEKYRLECPTCIFENQFLKCRNVLVRPDYFPRYYHATSPVERNVYRLHIPYNGSRDLLRYRPSTYILSGWSQFVVEQENICVDILDLDNDAEKIKREIGGNVSSLTKMLGYLKADIDTFNNDLLSYIRHAFNLCKENAIKRSQISSDLGIPIKSNVAQRTYPVPTITRRISQPPKGDVASKRGLDPTMDIETYNQILDSINKIGQSFERFPDTVKDKNEEGIRALFLTQLITTFTSFSATGESFNRSGKTDIMVKYDASVVFIAECKMWKGKRAFLDAIDQLLSYLTWRDSKTSLIIFVRQTNISTVIKVIKGAVVTHPSYVSSESQSKPGWLNYKFRLPQDPDKIIHLAVQVFDFSNR